MSNAARSFALREEYAAWGLLDDSIFWNTAVAVCAEFEASAGKAVTMRPLIAQERTEREAAIFLKAWEVLLPVRLSVRMGVRVVMLAFSLGTAELGGRNQKRAELVEQIRSFAQEIPTPLSPK